MGADRSACAGGRPDAQRASASASAEHDTPSVEQACRVRLRPACGGARRTRYPFAKSARAQASRSCKRWPAGNCPHHYSCTRAPLARRLALAGRSARWLGRWLAGADRCSGGRLSNTTICMGDLGEISVESNTVCPPRPGVCWNTTTGHHHSALPSLLSPFVNLQQHPTIIFYLLRC